MSAASRPKIFGTGLIALDLVVGPDPYTLIGNCTGGTCGNVLSILAYLGWDAYPIARMNRDAASERVRADLGRWGVHLDWTGCNPTAPTPIIVQRIRRGPGGRSEHRFLWSCPHCGTSLPAYKAITLGAAEGVKPSLAHAAVFFLDRLSPAALTLAAEAAAHGALVVFEPSIRGNEKQVAEAVKIAHVVKYAGDRLRQLHGVMDGSAATLLEVQTLGAEGLRYRHRLNGGISKWMRLEAVPARDLADSCGCGDWCTAGLIDQVGQAVKSDSVKSVPRVSGTRFATDKPSPHGIADSKALGEACTLFRERRSSVR